MKPPEQQLAEWVADAITFDMGKGPQVMTRDEFARSVAMIVVRDPKDLLAYSSLKEIMANFWKLIENVNIEVRGPG